jgi:cytoskeleton protein RodZ
MTRSRSRKKKMMTHHGLSAATTGHPGQGAPPTNLALPLSQQDVAHLDDPDADASADVAEFADAESESGHRDTIESPTGTDLLAPAARSSMRIEVTEERSLLGMRLRAARESRGWSREDVAHRLHVPTTVIADIETERFERLGAPIYVRGYLSKYAHLVELPQVVVNRALEGMSEPVLRASTDAPLVIGGWDRHKFTILSGVITLAIVVAVGSVISTRGIYSPVPQVRSLDESELSEPIALTPPAPAPVQMAPTAVPVVDGSASAPLASVSEVQPAADVDPSVEAPAATETVTPNPALLASMTGFSTPATEGMHVVEAHFREDSWIEIFDSEGRVIEQNLVRAGQSRRYESTGVVSVKVGNVGGVDLRADGNPIDLAVHARANVARLRLFEAAATPTP